MFHVFYTKRSINSFLMCEILRCTQLQGDHGTGPVVALKVFIVHIIELLSN